MSDDGKSWIQTHGAWLQLAVVLLLQVSTIVYFARGLTDGQGQLSEALTELKVQVRDLGAAVGRLASASEREDEHLRSVDRRLDRLEVGKWERTP